VKAIWEEIDESHQQAAKRAEDEDLPDMFPERLSEKYSQCKSSSKGGSGEG